MKQDSKTALGHLLLLLSLCLIFAFLVAYRFYFSAAVLAIVTACEVYYLFRLMEKNTKLLMHFIWSVRYSDFLMTKLPDSGQSDTIPKELAVAMEEALSHYKKNLQQKESQLQYFQALANHIDLSVIVFATNGAIEWTNQAARQQTGLPAPQTIDDLQAFHSELPARLRALRPGELSILQVTRGEECYQLALSGMSFVVLGRPLTVVSMKNIRTVLETQETEAWQKLIRVLTHEIMNSMTPIVSLSELVKNAFSPNHSLSADEEQELTQAIETIYRRSNGLLRFVENYRKVTGIPAPVLQVVSVSDLLTSTFQLLKSEMNGLQLLTPSVYLQIIADKGQIEQVLINLIKNAQEALSNHPNPSIELSAGINSDGHTYIQIADNGSGIAPDTLERIFIPFFTTKPAGSGIGLSLSRQIMHMHHGNLNAVSETGKGSKFTLTFH